MAFSPSPSQLQHQIQFSCSCDILAVYTSNTSDLEPTVYQFHKMCIVERRIWSFGLLQ